MMDVPVWLWVVGYLVAGLLFAKVAIRYSPCPEDSGERFVFVALWPMWVLLLGMLTVLVFGGLTVARIGSAIVVALDWWFDGPRHDGE
jgi:hypothetical protein